jgi:hypothetical protein
MKMFSARECRIPKPYGKTEMELLPLQTPNASPQLYNLLRERKPAIIVFESGTGDAGLLMGDVTDDSIYILMPPKLTRSSSRYERDGTPYANEPRMLAWRTWDGFWHVIDSAVSALLPVIDNHIEGDET